MKKLSFFFFVVFIFPFIGFASLYQPGETLNPDCAPNTQNCGLITSPLFFSNDGNLAVGARSFDSVNPEKLLVEASSTNSVNAIYAKGNVDNYFQINIQNRSTGVHGSSDLVATADNGTETTNFMNVGINGSGYAYNPENLISTGAANDGYIISAGQNFYIANNNPSTDIRFLTGGTADTNEHMRITAQGNVGIGSASFDATHPEALLVDAGHTSSVNAIYAKGTIDNYLQINVKNNSNGDNASADVVATADNGTETTNYIDMGINSSGYKSGYVGNANDAYLYSTGENLLIGNVQPEKDIIFFTGGQNAYTNERMRFTGDGKLGIGTNNPVTQLDIRGTFRISTGTTPGIFMDNTDGFIGIGTESPLTRLHVVGDPNSVGNKLNLLMLDRYGVAHNATIVMRAARGTVENPSALQDGDVLGGLSGRGYGTSAFSESARIRIEYEAAENWTDSAQGTYMEFYTTPIGTTNLTEGMRLDDQGNLGIGIDAMQKLDVNGRIRMRTWTADGDTAVYKNADGDIGIQSSDVRTKKNIVTIQNALNTVKSLRGVLFNRVTDTETKQKTLGFISQEVKTVLPEAVFPYTNEKGEIYYGVHYDKIGPVLVEAIKEQQKQIDALNVKNGIFRGNYPAQISKDGTVSFTSPYLITDSVGHITLKPGETKVIIAFPKKYSTPPIVVISPNDFITGQYKTTNITESGFSLVLNQKQKITVEFSWHAFGGYDTKTIPEPTQ